MVCITLKCHGEPCALLQTLDAYLAPVSLDDSFGDRQPQPTAGVSGRIAPPVKAPKQLWQVFLWDADAIVLDGDDHLPWRLPG